MEVQDNHTESENLIHANLWGELEEDPAYLSKQIITYIGNKRSLLSEIDIAVEQVKNRLGKDRIRILDAFSGSGVVSRNFKRNASYLAAIDLEDYAAVVADCYLRNRSDIDFKEIEEIVCDINARVDKVNIPTGFIQEMYAPSHDDKITKNDRVFYSTRNARRLDNYRRMFDNIPSEYKNLLMGPLLCEASVHANTSGVFKGFYKDKNSKIGCFGGTNGDALTRILGDIYLEVPILSRFECDVDVFQGDANLLAPKYPILILYIWIRPTISIHMDLTILC